MRAENLNSLGSATGEFKRVLIVDDDLALLPLWKIIFTRHSKETRVEWAVSSEEGQRLIREAAVQGRGFDLIIADIFLAGSETGFEFLKSDDVKSMNAKTILVSSSAQRHLEAHCRELLPGTMAVAKPLNVVKCERVLKELKERGEV